MEMNIESVLSHLGFDYRLKDGNIEKKTLFKNVSTIQQAKEEDLCYCSFEGEEAVSLKHRQITIIKIVLFFDICINHVTVVPGFTVACCGTDVHL